MELRSLKSKHAAEMTIGTIIVIILAVIVLAVLVFGFAGGWKNLWDKIINLGGGSSNVDTVVLACKTACETNSKNDYCNVARIVNFADGTKATATCKELTTNRAGCVAADGTSIDVVQEKDCRKKGTWYDKICILNGVKSGEVITKTGTADSCSVAGSLITSNVCLGTDNKPLADTTINSKAKCEDQSWKGIIDVSKISVEACGICG